MIIDRVGHTTIITQEKASTIELVKKLDVLYERHKNQNIIVVLTGIKPIPVSDVVEFLQLSRSHKANKQSFVIVNNKVALDDLPDDLVVVPTLQEAHDLIEMEVIERDLGF